MRSWRSAILAVGLLIAGAAGIYAWNLSRTFDTQTIKIPEAFPTDESSRPPVVLPVPEAEAEAEATKAQNILLLGSDTRGSNSKSIADLSGQRSDTIMVMHIPANRKNIYVMSILRDSWLDIPGHGQAKINAALSFGGVPLAVQTIEGLLGVRMDHVAIIDFQGFKDVTDALGGIDVDNPIGFASSSIRGHYFAPGIQSVNGAEALAFVRERYAFRDGDFQRARNQQQFIKALLSKSLSAETLMNPAKVSRLIGAVAPHLAVDEGLDSAYVAGLAVELRDVRVGDVTLFTMPTNGTGTSPDGQSIVNIDWTALTAVQQGFQTDTLDAYQPEVQTIG
ncbi:LytR family transcriptional regulator [Cryobacterium suzukii]|uniref:LytR family transcriptional regulator n=1 Tax=Cryobacterium suzukii TaxID=1259198 RepID=A0A4R9AL50_9MICO|nr:LCP family protein [Cryobacterium suzukii]TFD63133.1 LytR family transcriptional regulator [Cryobacterium suzukii]